jgi:hypothetical protein
MTAAWVAATVRGRALARRRVGTVRARRIAAAPDLDTGLLLLAGSAFDRVAVAGTSLRTAERAVRAEQLWELRVLAGWMPAAGTPLARALAARYELANIEARRDRLAGRAVDPPFPLGTLAISWPRLAAASSLDALRAELVASPWGDPGDGTATALHDALVVAWLRMVAAAATGMSTVQRWVRAGAALLVARTVFVLQQQPSEPLLRAVTPLLGRRWAAARTTDEFRAALPATARWVLADVDGPGQLWRAEAQLRAQVEADGYRMLREAIPGPGPVVGALAVLAVDGWRVRAALAAAAAGAGENEVLDVVA